MINPAAGRLRHRDGKPACPPRPTSASGYLEFGGVVLAAVSRCCAPGSAGSVLGTRMLRPRRGLDGKLSRARSIWRVPAEAHPRGRFDSAGDYVLPCVWEVSCNQGLLNWGMPSGSRVGVSCGLAVPPRAPALFGPSDLASVRERWRGVSRRGVGADPGGVGPPPA